MGDVDEGMVTIAGTRYRLEDASRLGLLYVGRHRDGESTESAEGSEEPPTPDEDTKEPDGENTEGPEEPAEGAKWRRRNKGGKPGANK